MVEVKAWSRSRLGREGFERSKLGRGQSLVVGQSLVKSASCRDLGAPKSASGGLLRSLLDALLGRIGNGLFGVPLGGPLVIYAILGNFRDI